MWTARDALEFIIAGAAAVQLGTVNFTHPARWVEVVAGIEEYLVRHGFSRVADLVGSLEV